MKNILVLLFLFSSINSIAQNNYWQQYLRYSIDVKLNEAEKSIEGKETIVYKNNSPETLNFIWFHIYPNAYKNEKTALFRQINKDAKHKEKIKSYTYGSISNLSFTVNGTAATTEPHSNPDYIDIIKVNLPQPLKPGDSATIATPFKVQLPSYFSRSGFSNGEFIICQWYPKPAVFDADGWHEMPYLDMGEFYSEFASYNVNITVPSAYVVSATGTLQSPAEATSYKSIGAYNYSNKKKPKLYTPVTTEASKTLSYYADSVPDFAWFADKDFVIQYDTIQMASGRTVDGYTFYHSKSNNEWKNSLDFVKDAVHHYSNWIGEYAYPVVQAVEGPKNNLSGGMEYPMVTIITSPDAKVESLDGVIAHEVGHNWFMSMLGSNERVHPWMDEGLNTYYQFRYEAEKYRANTAFGDKLPAALKQLPEDIFLLNIYKVVLQIPIKPAMATASEQYADHEEYAMTSYLKGASWMFVLEQSVGRDTLDKLLHAYFDQWKFKHPKPSDMQASFEQTLNANFDQFFALINKEGQLVQ